MQHWLAPLALSLILLASPVLAQWEALEGDAQVGQPQPVQVPVTEEQYLQQQQAPTPLVGYGQPEGQPDPYAEPMQMELPEGEVEAPMLEEAEPEAEPEAEIPAAKPDNEEREGSNLRYIVLRGLNKVTAKAEQFTVPVGSTERFGNLEVVGKNCWKAAATERPESAALLDIWEHRPDDPKPTRIFVGWMFASSPSVSAMEHAVYDVTVIDCRRTDKAEEPAEAAPAEAVEEKPAEEAAPVEDDTGGY